MIVRVCSVLLLTMIFFVLSACEKFADQPGIAPFVEDTEDYDDTGSRLDSEADTLEDTEVDTGGGVDTGPFPDSESVCDELDIDVEMVPARLMILQDMSGSMLYDENDQLQQPPTKWDQARSALKKLLRNDKLELEYGIDTFPGMGDCGVRWNVMSDTVPNNETKLINKLNILSPGGGTPLWLAMNNFTKPSYAPRFLSDEATSYLLVVSDGADTCGIYGQYDDWNGATPKQLGNITTRLLNKFGVKTFVIGFGKGTEAKQLNAIAAAGGTGRNTFIDAQNGAELESQILSIASSVVSCVYDLKEQDGAEVDLNKVNFYFDGEVVKMDESCSRNTGWTWVGDEKNRVQFCEAACEQLQSGGVNKISATYGCHQVIVE